MAAAVPRSTSASVISRCQRVATMARLSPVASTTPAPGLPAPAALVPGEVEHDPAALGGDRRHGLVQLRAAVAAQRAEHVPGQALGVQPGQHALAVDIAEDQRHVLGAVDLVPVAERLPVA